MKFARSAPPAPGSPVRIPGAGPGTAWRDTLWQASHLESRGGWARMSAQGQSSSADRGGLAADVRSGLIFLKNKIINRFDKISNNTTAGSRLRVTIGPMMPLPTPPTPLPPTIWRCRQWDSFLFVHLSSSFFFFFRWGLPPSFPTFFFCFPPLFSLFSLFFFFFFLKTGTRAHCQSYLFFLFLLLLLLLPRAPQYLVVYSL